jgi:Polyketide cyclase / dehydrase and lipid transport
MAKSYYSTVFNQSADIVWSVLRDFGNYTVWAEGVDEAYVEGGKSGDAVGAVRFVRVGETRIRQKLRAHSDVERCYTYELCEPYRFPVRNGLATIRVTPVTDTGQSFIEWWVIFDCAEHEYDHWVEFFATSFARWLASLRRQLDKAA